MNINELKEKVLSKIKKRPDTIYIKADYLEDQISDAINDVLDFVNYKKDGEFPETFITIAADLCIIRLNATGNEGLSSSSKAGTSESYSGDIPMPIKRKLRKYRKIA